MPSGGCRLRAGRKKTLSRVKRIEAARRYHVEAKRIKERHVFEWAFSLCDDAKLSELIGQTLYKFDDFWNIKGYAASILRRMIDPHDYNFILGDNQFIFEYYPSYRPASHHLSLLMIENAQALESMPRVHRFRDELVYNVASWCSHTYDFDVSISQVNKAIREFPYTYFDFGHR